MITLFFTRLPLLKIGILIITSIFLISCHSFRTDQIITYDLKKIPSISKVKLSDLGFDDIRYIPLETNEQSIICDLFGLFSHNEFIFGKKFFLIKCGNVQKPDALTVFGQLN
jgi:hypothetical protein